MRRRLMVAAIFTVVWLFGCSDFKLPGEDECDDDDTSAECVTDGTGGTPGVTTDSSGNDLGSYPCSFSSFPSEVTLAQLVELGQYQLTLANADRAHFTQESDSATALVWNTSLHQAALCHAKAMCEQAFFSHVDPSGATPRNRIDQAFGGDSSSTFNAVAENIAGNTAGSTNSLDSMKVAVNGHHHSYMNECVCNDGCATQRISGHRTAILSPIYTDVGIGVWYCPSERSWLNTMNFGRDRNKPQREASAYCADGHTEDPPTPYTQAPSVGSGGFF